MNFETRKAYTELCAVLEYMPNEYVKKVPQKIIDLFESEKLEKYEVNINKSNPLDKTYLSKKALVLIAMLNNQYWSPNKKAKDNLYKMYLSNNDKYQNIKKENNYSYNDLFEKNLTKVDDKVENVEMVKYKEPIFKRIINIIKRIFNR